MSKPRDRVKTVRQKYACAVRFSGVKISEKTYKWAARFPDKDFICFIGKMDDSKLSKRNLMLKRKLNHLYND